MSAAAKYLLAQAMYGNHTDRCPLCEAWSVDRCNAGCTLGRRLSASLDGAWRRRIVALSDRGRL